MPSPRGARSWLPGRRGGGLQAAQSGFTLVEVLVALAAMALLAALSWQGLDSVLRSRDASRLTVDDAVRVATVLTQWEQDLQGLHDSTAVPPLDFDGQTLRLTRRVEGGVALVCWSVRNRVWQRWVSPAFTRSNELQDVWLRSRQFMGNEAGQLQVASGASEWQIYFYRGNGWSNAQSSGDLRIGSGLPNAGVAAAAPSASAASAAAAAAAAETAASAAAAAGAASAPATPAAAASAPPPSAAAPLTEQLPAAVRLLITLDGKKLTRDIALGPSGS